MATIKYTEEEYREAALICKKKNKELKTITINTVVKISSGKEIPIGTRMRTMRRNIEKLTEEQKEFWKDYGIYEGYPTEEENRMAAMIWRKENPQVMYIPYDTVIILPNGRRISLGLKIVNLRANLHKLSEEQKEFWKNYGLYYGEKYRNSLRKEFVRMAANIKGDNHLTKRERSAILKMFSSYKNPLKEYQKLEVGLEEDKEMQLEKIKQYQFDELDIEDSYFLACDFKRLLLQSQKEELLQKRYDLLRQYIIDWNYYSKEEQQKECDNENISIEELEFIEKTRIELDAMIKNLKR